ncbi:DinB family protein [Piscibacillus halophilus]|uniref:DinB superfamily protein n=1 Tax=Piscibacillus halophilus TaxID=571933 RepID=A0A1H9GN90_9BACI|nr:DinB family protein [Piscibacillus halophilus]SEQ51463.1 DinB superfamily protein [Piscibacillus halophilus]
MSEKTMMHEETVLNQWKLWRSWVVGFIDIVPEEHYDEIPEPFKNNIRWNAGHLLVGFDDVVASALGTERQLSEKYHMMFPRGSSPADWKEEPPAMEEIKEKLRRQPEELEELIKGKLDTPLKKEFMGMNTLGEAIQFLSAHDALHLSTMNAMRRILKNNNK